MDYPRKGHGTRYRGTSWKGHGTTGWKCYGMEVGYPSVNRQIPVKSVPSPFLRNAGGKRILTISDNSVELDFIKTLSSPGTGNKMYLHLDVLNN